jgi:hypothetical protein
MLVNGRAGRWPQRLAATASREIEAGTETMRYVLRRFSKNGSATEDIGSFETLEKARSAMKLAAQGRKLTPLEESYCLHTGEQYLIFKEGYWEPLTRVDRGGHA